ncbi:MAG: ATP-binding protein [Sneathiellaceae bacterium]
MTSVLPMARNGRRGFRRLALHWQFMLAPLLGAAAMAVLALVLVDLRRDQVDWLAELRAGSLEQIRTFSLLENRTVQSHASIYQLLVNATQRSDEGEFYRESKPLLIELHDIEDRLAQAIEQTALQGSRAGPYLQLASDLETYRISATNALLMATVDFELADRVIRDTTANFNRVNAQFLAIDHELNDRLRDLLAEQGEALDNQSRVLALVFGIAIVLLLLSSSVLALILSRDLRRSIQDLNALTSTWPDGGTSDDGDGFPATGSETELLAAAIAGARERQAILLRARGELEAANARLQASHEEVARREATLAQLNTTLNDRVGELHRVIRERDEAEAALGRSQRLEAVGQLTGGIAHDFNNLLSVMLGNAELLEDSFAGNPPAQRQVATIKAAVARGESLTSRLLAFSRKQSLSPRATDVSQLIRGLEELLQRSLGAAIDLTVISAGGLWPVWLDEHQFEAALVNLAINARDAMPRGGSLTIETSNVVLDNSYADLAEELAPGDYVSVSVSDTGSGMSAEVQSRAFEPFFTTKDVGQGSGLGLSMVYGFMKQSRGHVTIYSEAGQGSSVRLYLPRLAQARADDPAPVVAAPVPQRGSERILVVEDDVDLREIPVTLLRRHGYIVEQAGDGQAALQLLRKAPTFDLMFTDVVLPGDMNGMEIAAEAQRLQPGIRVVYATGYAENAVARSGQLQPDAITLTKPYRGNMLLETVRRVLDS